MFNFIRIAKIQKGVYYLYIFFIILKLILVLLLVIIITSIILIMVPFKYEISTDLNKKVKFKINILWLFNCFMVSIVNNSNNLSMSFFILNNHVYTKQIKKMDDKKPINKTSKKNKIECIYVLKNHFNKILFNLLITYFKDIFIIIKPSSVRIQGTYTFEDPSITGILCGFMPLIAETIPLTNINLYPSFNDEVTHITANISGQITLSIIAFKTLELILVKEVRKILFKRFKIH
jgi:hypothetical protein